MLCLCKLFCIQYEVDFNYGKNAQLCINLAFYIHVVSSNLTLILVVTKIMTEVARYDTLKGAKLFQYSTVKSVVSIGLIALLFPQPWLNNVAISSKFRDNHSFSQ